MLRAVKRFIAYVMHARALDHHRRSVVDDPEVARPGDLRSRHVPGGREIDADVAACSVEAPADAASDLSGGEENLCPLEGGWEATCGRCRWSPRPGCRDPN